MAFEISDYFLELTDISSLDGCYLVPYHWMRWAFKNEKICVMDPQGFKSLQMQIYHYAESNRIESHFSSLDTGACDVWLIFKSDGTNNCIERLLIPDAPLKKDVSFLETRRGSIPCIRVKNILEAPPLYQIDYNRAILKLLRGCKIRMVNDIWSFDKPECN